MSSSLFHKALKEAFEAFCNKQVAGCTIAEIMANFCNNLLKRVRCLPEMAQSQAQEPPNLSHADCYQCEGLRQPLVACALAPVGPVTGVSIRYLSSQACSWINTG